MVYIEDQVKGHVVHCTKSATSELDEYSKARERTMLKELGKMTL